MDISLLNLVENAYKVSLGFPQEDTFMTWNLLKPLETLVTIMLSRVLKSTAFLFILCTLSVENVRRSPFEILFGPLNSASLQWKWDKNNIKQTQ